MCLQRPVSAHVVMPDQSAEVVGGRLRRFAAVWKDPAIDPVVRRWVSEGVSLDFPEGPPSERPPVDSAAALRSDPVRYQACVDTVSAYLTKRMISRVPKDEEGRGCYQRVFPVPKKGTGQWRGCLDCRPVNEGLEYQHFKMEGLHTIRDLLSRDDWLTSIDLSDAYAHLSIHPQSRQYLRFVWNGLHYQFDALPFGLGPAPRIFTKLLRPVLARIRARGVRVVAYLDDLCILTRGSRERSVRHTQIVVDELVRAGFLCHPTKSEVTPSRTREFLGLTIDSHRLLLRVPPEKVKATTRAIRQTIAASQSGSLTIRGLAGLIGKLQALGPAVSPARFRSRSLLHLKNEALAGSRVRWDHPVVLDAPALAELSWWLTEFQQWNGKSILPLLPQCVLTTDASSYGWGGWLGNKSARGFWSRPESRRSSNARELTAVVFSVFAFAPMLAGRVVHVRTDNITTRAYINHQGGRSRFLTELYRPLQLWLERTNTVLVASHLAGKLNKRADALSRWKRDRSDWRLNPRVFRRVDRMWGRHTVDLFATRLNAQLPRFVSWWHDPEAWATDAFLQDLRPENAYANPPFSMVARLLAMVRRQRATMTVIVPVWRTQPWWPMLAEMAVDCPLLFLPSHDLFLPGHLGSETPMGAPRWPALAVRISGAPSRVAAFQRHLSECSVGRGAQPPTRATRVPGGSGFGGQGNTPWIPFNRSQ